MDSQVLDDPRINEMVNHTDTEGITHIHVMDSGKVYRLVDGAWVEQAPF